MEVVRELCSFENRLAGSDAERRASAHVAERLGGLGRRVEIEPTYVHPQFALVHALHCTLGFAGSLVAISLPALGFALVLLAAVSMYLDLTYRVYILRRLFFRRGSQNVVSPGRSPGAAARLIVCAHVDAGRTGGVFGERRARRAASLGRRFPWLGPFRILFWSLALLLPALGARMAGLDSNVVSLIQLIPTLVLLVGAFALVEIELSPVSPGASDDATGVAAALSLAAELEGEPVEHLDVWFVLDGAAQCLQEGMRSFVRAHRRRLDRDTTFVLSLDTLGAGNVRYETAAGWVASYGMDKRLIELSSAIADAHPALGAEPLAHAYAQDSMVARQAGLRAIGVTCLEDGYGVNVRQPGDLPENVDPAAVDRAHDFALALIRALDRDVGRGSR